MINPEVPSFELDAILQEQGLLPPFDQSKKYSSELQTMAEIRFRKIGLESNFQQSKSFVLELRQTFLPKTVSTDETFNLALATLHMELTTLANSTATDSEVNKASWKILRKWLRDQVSFISNYLIKMIDHGAIDSEDFKQLRTLTQKALACVPLEQKKATDFNKLKKILEALRLSSLTMQHAA